MEWNWSDNLDNHTTNKINQNFDLQVKLFVNKSVQFLILFEITVYYAKRKILYMNGCVVAFFPYL